MQEKSTKAKPYAEQGKALRAAREALNKTQSRVLEDLERKGAGEGLIQNWERGLNAPGRKYWGLLNKSLGIDVAALYLGDGRAESGMVPVAAIRPLIDELQRKLTALYAICGKPTSSERVEAAGISKAPAAKKRKSKVTA